MRTPETPGPHPGWIQRHCTTELVDGERALFRHTCKNCGHVFDKVFKVGPTGQRKPASPDACRLMAKVWGGYGHCKAYCPKCSYVKKPS